MGDTVSLRRGLGKGGRGRGKGSPAANASPPAGPRLNLASPTAGPTARQAVLEYGRQITSIYETDADDRDRDILDAERPGKFLHRGSMRSVDVLGRAVRRSHPKRTSCTAPPSPPLTPPLAFQGKMKPPSSFHRQLLRGFGLYAAASRNLKLLESPVRPTVTQFS